jgi:hypothetical protein
MSRAGRSAQERYETLAARHRAGRSFRLLTNLGVATIVAVVVIVIYGERQASLVPWLIGLVYLIAILKAVVEPNHLRAWSIGAEGERITGRDLEKLPQGYRVLHDLRIVGSRANVDHVAIGPTGVWVIESIRLRGKLRVRGEEVFVGGRRRRMVEEVRSEVVAVESVLFGAGIKTPVRPVLYIQEADPPWFLSRPAGIPIVLSGRKLRKLITSGDEVLTQTDVHRASQALSNRLGRSTHPSTADAGSSTEPARGLSAVGAGTVLAACPRCGGEMVLRRSKNGEQFLGCSAFPRCRGTRDWPVVGLTESDTSAVRERASRLGGADE